MTEENLWEAAMDAGWPEQSATIKFNLTAESISRHQYHGTDLSQHVDDGSSPDYNMDVDRSPIAADDNDAGHYAERTPSPDHNICSPVSPSPTEYSTPYHDLLQRIPFNHDAGSANDTKQSPGPAEEHWDHDLDNSPIPSQQNQVPRQNLDAKNFSPANGRPSGRRSTVFAQIMAQIGSGVTAHHLTTSFQQPDGRMEHLGKEDIEMR